MPCTNCFNGCTDTQSDKCVKYTGPTITSLGITTGDTLLSVEENITTFLLSALDGTGIIPYINPVSLCALVSGYLPSEGSISLNELVDALIKSICSLQEQVTSVTEDMTILNADYTVGCLTGVMASSGTHAILQQAITQICAMNASIVALALELSTNYVAIADLNSYIAAYLAETSATTLISNKMVPYAVVEYYGPLSYFDGTGAGTGDWINIYLCNGLNSTPDKRGRVAVGATTGMGGSTFNSAVDPAIAGNPTYTLGTIYGANNITLNLTQIPAHTHVATVTEVPHSHSYTPSGQDNGNIGTYIETGNAENYAPDNTVNSAVTGITVSNASQGGGLAHSNIQPVMGCYYIQYRP